MRAQYKQLGLLPSRHLNIIRIDSLWSISLHGSIMRLLLLQRTACWSLFFGMCAVLTAEVEPAPAHPPARVPAATFPSASPAKSLAMLLQVVKQLEHYVQTTNLSSIHNEDEILRAAASELFTQASLVAPNQSDDFKADLAAFCQNVSALHLAADLSRQTRAETALGEVLKSFATVKGYFSPQIIAAAQPSLDTFTCPLHPEVTGKSRDFCFKCGGRLDQFCRILPANSPFPQGQPTMRASVKIATPLTVGQPVNAILRLEKLNGIPIQLSDLIETHTRRIHLLILDHSMTDYHHEHPQPTRTPGEYSFAFTPRQPGPYRVWADLRPYPLGLQEYAQTDIPAPTAGAPFTNREPGFEAQVDGINFELRLEPKAISAGQPTAATLRVTTADGKDFAQLEPVMASFAHVVGFNEDYQTVLHLHPKGPAVLDASARGGPELEFIIYALRPGFVRLFAQVQIEGRPRFASFGFVVAP
jgi:hypothetical protein